MFDGDGVSGPSEGDDAIDCDANGDDTRLRNGDARIDPSATTVIAPFPPPGDRCVRVGVTDVNNDWNSRSIISTSRRIDCISVLAMSRT